MIDAIILAAGRSQRMGTQKLLLPFAGQTVIGHVVDQVLAAPVRHAFVVVADNNNAVAAALSEKRVKLVVNSDPTAQMLSSVRFGLRALPPDAAAALIVLGDQPSLRAEFIGRLVHELQAAGKGIVLPLHAGRRGHPLIVERRYFQEILTQYDDTGLRGLLAAHANDVYELPVFDSGVLADMDFPEDYLRELERHRDAP